MNLKLYNLSGIPDTKWVLTRGHSLPRPLIPSSSITLIPWVPLRAPLQQAWVQCSASAGPLGQLGRWVAAWQCRSDPAVEGARPCCPNPRHPRDPATGLRVSSPPSRVQSLFCSHHSRCPRLEWRRDSVCFKGRGQRSLARPLCREDGGNSPAFEGGQREAQRSGPSWAYLALEWQSSLCPLDLAGPGRLPRFWVSLTGG